MPIWQITCIVVMPSYLPRFALDDITFPCDEGTAKSGNNHSLTRALSLHRTRRECRSTRVVNTACESVRRRSRVRRGWSSTLARQVVVKEVCLPVEEESCVVAVSQLLCRLHLRVPYQEPDRPSDGPHPQANRPSAQQQGGEIDAVGDSRESRCDDAPLVCKSCATPVSFSASRAHHMLPCYAVCIYSTHHYAWLMPACHGSLQDWVQQRYASPPCPLPHEKHLRSPAVVWQAKLRLCQKVAHDILQALAYLHHENTAGVVVHGDVSWSNILIHHMTREGVDGTPCCFVLADWDLMRSVQEGAEEGTSGGGSVWYMSPDRLRGCVCASAADDIWSLGVVLFGLLSDGVAGAATRQAHPCLWSCENVDETIYPADGTSSCGREDGAALRLDQDGAHACRGRQSVTTDSTVDFWDLLVAVDRAAAVGMDLCIDRALQSWCGAEVRDFLTACLSLQAHARPTAMQLLRMPWMQAIAMSV